MFKYSGGVFSLMHFIEAFTQPDKMVRDALRKPSLSAILSLNLVPLFLTYLVLFYLGAGFPVYGFLLSLINTIIVVVVLSVIVYEANVLLQNKKAVEGNLLGLLQANSVFWIYWAVFTVLFFVLLLAIPKGSIPLEIATGTLTEAQFVAGMKGAFVLQDVLLLSVLVFVQALAFLVFSIYQFYSWFAIFNLYERTLHRLIKVYNIKRDFQGGRPPLRDRRKG